MSAQVGHLRAGFRRSFVSRHQSSAVSHPLYRMELTVPAVLSGVCRTDNFYQGAGEDDR
jgi:hypothetical protein